MTSAFESEVYQREHHTPYARIDLVGFMKEMALDGSTFENQLPATVTLSVHYRHPVASRFWWSVSWIGPDGERHEAEGQHLDKCLWRAVTIQLRLEEKQKQEEEP
jgi:hypothetical protein